MLLFLIGRVDQTDGYDFAFRLADRLRWRTTDTSTALLTWRHFALDGSCGILPAWQHFKLKLPPFTITISLHSILY